MNDIFYIGAYWGIRAESIDEITSKILTNLKSLSHIDIQFTSWYKLSSSKQNALKSEINYNNPRDLASLCLSNIKQGELNDRGYSKHGFSFSLWTGHENDKACKITFCVGGQSKNLINSCVITIPNHGFARDRLLKFENVKSIISLLIQVWEPEYAVLTSRELRKSLNVGNRIGWVTYWNKSKLDRIEGIEYESLGNGHLFYIKANDYSTVDPSSDLTVLSKC